MKKIELLDCTLRDGGYINNWEFGVPAIIDISACMTEGGADIFEIGFLKNEPYKKGRTVFNSASQIEEIIGKKRPDVSYAAMIEVENPIPLEMLEEYTGKSIDIIRVIVWKRLLQEGFAYCRGIVEKGYRLCVQPARVDQYTDEEFENMCRLFNQIDPMAVYVVDSWGTLGTERIMNYVKLADQNLKKDIAIGYHGHNNMMQAYGTAVKFTQWETDRKVIVDASIYGIGRGAGNLNLELIARYLNINNERNYRIDKMIYIYEKYLKAIYQKHSWGYSIPYFLTAIYGCNPNYADYYSRQLRFSESRIDTMLRHFSAEDKIIFSKKTADRYIEIEESVRRQGV